MSQTTTRPEAAPVSDETRRDRIIAAFNDNTDAGRLKATNEATAAQQSNPNFWNEHRAAINAAVDFRAQGFPDDLQIVGINSRGQILTTNENGTEQQVRDRRLRQIGSSQQISEGSEYIGNNGRRFTTNEQGQTTYRFRNGDNLEHIARDLLTHKNGKVPTNSEIAQAARDLARENNISNVRAIRNDTTIKIPDSMIGQAPGRDGRTAPTRDGRDPARVPERPPAPPPLENPGSRPSARLENGMPRDRARTGPTEGVYTNLAPPGAADSVSYWSELNGAYAQTDTGPRRTRPLQNGETETTYSRYLGAWRSTRADIKEVVNSAGITERVEGKYDKPISFHVQTPTGSEKIENVRSFISVRDANSGQYSTIYRLNDGRELTAITLKNGTVRFFHDGRR